MYICMYIYIIQNIYIFLNSPPDIDLQKDDKLQIAGGKMNKQDRKIIQ